MRTLKKALCLVLVLAMVFTLAVPALAVDAKDFTDYAEIENKEAVDVLVALNVISGNPDGSFNYAGTLTRAEGATMIAYLTLGKTIADALPASGTQFTDVPSTFWGAKYIQYCVNEGYLSGYGDGKFGPNDTLTPAAWSLMLARALGYVPANEGIGGAGWEIQATKLAMQAGIATADELAGTLSRDTAALMALNTLKADMVEYKTGGTTITTGDVTISTAASAATVVSNKDGKTDGHIDKDDEMQFAEKYFEDLSLTTVAKGGADEFGRPAEVWTLAGKSAPIAIDVIDAVMVITDGSTQTVAEKAVKTAGYKVDETVSYAVNGAVAGTDEDWGGKIAYANGYAAVEGEGNIVELYDTDNDKSIDHVVSIVPTFGKVTVTTTKENKTHGAFTTYKVGGTLTGDVYSTIVDEDKDVDSAIVSGTVANGDYVLYYVDQNGILYIEAVDTVTGTVTAASSKGVYTIDGASYSKAAAYETINSTDIAVSKKAGTYYVDSYGYILGVKEATTTTNYAFVMYVETYNALVDGKVVPSYSATLALPDGSVETLAIEEKSYDAYAALDGTAEKAAKYAASAAVSYADTNADGLYELTKVGSGAADRYSRLTGITAKATDLSTEGNSVKYANANTKFVVTNYETNSKGVRVATGTVTVYTGVANVPSYASTSAYALDTDSTKDGIANVVFVLVDTTASATSKYVYVVGTYTDTADGRAWDVIIDGEETTLVTGLTYDGLVAGTLYSKIEVGTSVAAVKVDDDNDVTKYSTMKYNGGILLTNSATLTCDGSVPVYTFDSTDKTVAVSTAADLTDGIGEMTAVVTKATDGTTITGIYVY